MARTGALFWLAEVTHRRFASLDHKAVMWALSQHVDANDQCFPGQATIAAFIQRSERKTRALLGELEADGLISRARRQDDQGHRTSDLIVLERDAILRLPESLPARGAARPGGPTGTTEPPLPAREATPTGTLVPDNKPEVEQAREQEPHPSPTGDAGADRNDPGYRFDDWWKAFPKRHGRRVGRHTAEERWRRLSYDTKALVFRATRHYAEACDRDETIAMDPYRFIGSTKRWEDWLEPVAPGQPRPGRPDRNAVAVRILENVGRSLG